MNERIRAYLKQHYCRDYFNSYGETVEDDHYFMYREDIDGLVELIVQECCALIAPSQEHSDDASLPYIGGAEGVELLTGSVRMIKEHFGVE